MAPPVRRVRQSSDSTPGTATTVLMRRFRIAGSQACATAPTPVADKVEGRVVHVDTDAAREFGALMVGERAAGLVVER